MEIRDYVHKRWRRLLLLPLLALVSAAVAFAVLRGQPQTYGAKVTVTVPPDDRGTYQPNEIGSYVTNFAEAVGHDPVQAKIAAAAGVPSSALDCVTVTQINRSNLLAAECISTNEAKATAIIDATATIVSDELARPGREAAVNRLSMVNRQVEKAHADLQVAMKAKDEFVQQNGLVSPRDDYQSRSAQLTQVQDALTEAQVEGLPLKARALQAIVDRRQAELAALGQKVMAFNALQEAVDRAAVSEQYAERGVIDASAQGSLGGRQAERSVVTTTKIKLVNAVGKGVAIAGGLAFVLAAALLVLLELRAPRPVGPVAPSDDQARIGKKPGIPAGADR